MEHDPRSEAYRARAKSEAVPHRSHLGWDTVDSNGLGTTNGQSSTNPFLTTDELQHQTSSNQFSSLNPWFTSGFKKLNVNGTNGTYDNASTQKVPTAKLRDVAEDAPELYVAETASHIDPELYSEAPTEDALLRRYGLENSGFPGIAGQGQTVRSRESGSQVVVRRIPKADSRKTADARREIAVLKAIAEDESIATLEEWLEVGDYLYMVNTYRNGAPLAQVVQTQGPLPEAIAKTALNQLFSGIATIFMAGFAHLRICDETVCLDENAQLLIKDFQYSTEYGKGKRDELYAETEDKFGSDIYVAPEVFANRTYNARKAVIWSCGVLLYFMITGQTEKLSNLNHPAMEGETEVIAPQPQSRRKASIAAAQASIISYPSRFAAPSWARMIIPKMLTADPTRRAELIEVATRVPKDYSLKATRPLMELAWLDYKTHVGPYAELNLAELNDSSRSSIFSAASNISNPFSLLLNRGHNRRKSTPITPRYG